MDFGLRRATLAAGGLHFTAQIFKVADDLLPKSSVYEILVHNWLYLSRGVWKVLISAFLADISVTANQMDALTLIVIMIGVQRHYMATDSEKVIAPNSWALGFLEPVVALLPAAIVLLVFLPGSPLDWRSLLHTYFESLPILSLGALQDINVSSMILSPVRLAGYFLFFGLLLSPLLFVAGGMPGLGARFLVRLRRRFSLLFEPTFRLLVAYVAAAPLGIAAFLIVLSAIGALVFVAPILVWGVINAGIVAANAMVGAGFALFGQPADARDISFTVTVLIYIALMLSILFIGIPRYRTLFSFIMFAAIVIILNGAVHWIEVTFGDDFRNLIQRIIEIGREA